MTRRQITARIDGKFGHNRVWEVEARTMTLEGLVSETLTEKNRRLRQEKCRHEEVYSSTVDGPNGTFTNKLCFDCGKSWHVSH